MALEVFPQELFGYGFKDLYNLLGGGNSNFLSYDYGVEEENIQKDIVSGNGGGEIINHNKQEAADTNWDISSSSLVRNVKEVQETNSSSEIVNGDGSSFLGFVSQISEDPVSISTATTTTTDSSTSGRRKRRRAKSNKNMEEVENQRMTHIAVERNRRRQMNEYLAVLRSLMPPSYVQRGDQASIIGGAINFVKELEQLLQSLESQKQAFKKSSSSSSSASPSLEDGSNNTGNAGVSIPFADFFTYPQYSSHSSLNQSSSIINSAASNGSESSLTENHPRYGPIADIEVTMVESHANLKILTKRGPKQLLKIATGFQTLRLNILHLNVTSTVDQLVLYSFSVKVEEDCQLTSVDEIATSVYQMLGTIQDETCSLS